MLKLTCFFCLQEIDGQALLLLNLPTVQECMDLKLGPAIKLCHHIERVKLAFYQQFASWGRKGRAMTFSWCLWSSFTSMDHRTFKNSLSALEASLTISLFTQQAQSRLTTGGAFLTGWFWYSYSWAVHLNVSLVLDYFVYEIFLLEISSAQVIEPESKELVHSVSARISKALVFRTFINCRADDNAITLSTK